MMPNPSLSEKLAQTHREDLLREAERQRMGAQLSETRRSKHILPTRLVSFLRAPNFGALFVRRAPGVPMRFE